MKSWQEHTSSFWKSRKLLGSMESLYLKVLQKFPSLSSQTLVKGIYYLAANRARGLSQIGIILNYNCSISHYGLVSYYYCLASLISCAWPGICFSYSFLETRTRTFRLHNLWIVLWRFTQLALLGGLVYIQEGEWVELLWNIMNTKADQACLDEPVNCMHLESWICCFSDSRKLWLACHFASSLCYLG